MDAHGQKLIQHGGEHHRLDVVVATAVPESVAEFAGLLEGTELDFDTPAKGIEVGDPGGRHLIGIEIGNEDAPPCPHKGFLLRLPAAAALGIGPEMTPVGLRSCGIEADGDESAREGSAAEDDGNIDEVARGGSEDLCDALPVEILGGNACRQTTDPECLTFLNHGERGQAEEAHVPYEKVTSVAEIGRFECQRLVCLTRCVELESEWFTGKQVGNEEALAACGHVVAVAIVGEEFGVRLGHGNDGGILDDNTLERRPAEFFDDGGEPLGKNMLDDREQERGACRPKAFGHPLAAHGFGGEAGEVHREMIEGCVPLDDRLEQGNEESGCVELARGSLDEPRFAGNPIKLIGLRQKRFFEHIDFAAAIEMSRLFSGKIHHNWFDRERLMTLA